MNIIAHEQEGVRKIIVQDLDKKSSIKDLLSYLSVDTKIEINFLNIQIIPRSIVLKLQEIKENVTIFTNESTLKSYLMNLGFDLKYHNNYEDKFNLVTSNPS
mgnify:CR=1 FL=1